MTHYDGLIVGGGIAGLAQTCALGASGFKVACVDPLPAQVSGQAIALDGRTTALLQGAIALLDRLGVWSLCRDSAAALSVMRIVDEAGRRADRPLTARFDSAEVGGGPFGYNIPNAALREALLACIRDLPTASHLAETTAEAISFDGPGAEITLSDGRRVSAEVVIGADGKRSPSREAAGLRARHWDYGQTAIAVSMTHSEPHHNVSVEFHRTSGPFVLVPLPGQRSSVVWVERNETARQLLALDDAAFRRALQSRTRGVLGEVQEVGPRGSYPAMSLIADRYAADRLALVGEAAHAMPPIGAQGLNLGLTDVATLTEVLQDARARGQDLGARAVLSSYERARRPDVLARVAAIDGLNRAVMSKWPPLQALRHLGLSAVDRLGPVKSRLMRQGMQPVGPVPALMRPAAAPDAAGRQ